MSFPPVDRAILVVMERTPTVVRRHLSHLTGVSPMTVSRAVDRLIRAGILSEMHAPDPVSGRQGRLLTLRPEPPLVWLDLSSPYTSSTALLTDSLLRPLCRIERRYSELHSDEDNLRLLLNELCRHPAAARYLTASGTQVGIVATPPDGTWDSLPLLRGVMDDLFPACHLTIVPAEQAVIEACLHAVPHDCERLLCLHTGEHPRAATLQIQRDAGGTAHVRAENGETLTATLARYLGDESDTSVERFVLDYRQFHAPSPAVWICNADPRTESELRADNLYILEHCKALICGSLLTARRALWADLLKTM